MSDVPAGLADLPDGAMRAVALPCGKLAALYRVDGGYYATDDECTHGQSSLSDEGELEGTTIVCGFHFGSFDVRTGEAIDSPCWEPLKTYAVIERDGELFLSAA